MCILNYQSITIFGIMVSECSKTKQYSVNIHIEFEANFHPVRSKILEIEIMLFVKGGRFWET